MMTAKIGEERSKQVMAELAKTNYRILFEQLFAPEAQAVAHMSHGFTAIRSPMIIGAYDVPYAKRKKMDLVKVFENKFNITNELLPTLLPDSLFDKPPQAICEIGGAWGATIAHLTNRFKPTTYHNYEPDRHFAEWADSRWNAKKMPCDGETLSGTETESMDLVIANNVLIFTPAIKTYSYIVEMRRVLRKRGVILFNAVLSDQISEEMLTFYLETSFPKREVHILPRDFIDRVFPDSEFEVFPIIDKEYCLIRRR